MAAKPVASLTCAAQEACGVLWHQCHFVDLLHFKSRNSSAVPAHNASCKYDSVFLGALVMMASPILMATRMLRMESSSLS